jgi:hypothetical protein
MSADTNDYATNGYHQHYGYAADNPANAHDEDDAMMLEEEEEMLPPREMTIWDKTKSNAINNLILQCLSLRLPILDRELQDYRQKSQFDAEIQRRKRLLEMDKQMFQRKKPKLSQSSGSMSAVPAAAPQLKIAPLKKKTSKKSEKIGAIRLGGSGVPSQPSDPSIVIVVKASKTKAKGEKRKKDEWSDDESRYKDAFDDFRDDESLSHDSDSDEDFVDYLKKASRKDKTKVDTGQDHLVVRAKSPKTLMLELLQKFRKLDKFKIFTNPVDVKFAPNYLQIIQNPMDFSTMEKNVHDNIYAKLEDFGKDVELIFRNCMTYNHPHTIFHKQAVAMKNTCSKLLTAAENEYGIVQQMEPFVLEFEYISEFLFPVDQEQLLQKMRVSPLPGCCGSCCYSYHDLGEFNLSTLTFDSSCADRKLCRECSGACQCDPNLCLNRSIADRKFNCLLEKQSVYGIDNYTFRQLCLACESLPDERKYFLLEKLVLPSLNKFIPLVHDSLTHMQHSLSSFLQVESTSTDHELLSSLSTIIKELSEGVRFPVFSKGYGIVNKGVAKIEKNQVVAEYVGEVYPPWRFFEKQCAIRNLEKKTFDSSSVLGFYNIVLERLKDDVLGYDVMFVDACRKGNIASRFSHSCNPNCTTVVMASSGRHAIAVLALRDIDPGEELTFNYHSVTDSLEEFESAICFCGQSMCKGRYVDYVGKETFQQIVQEKYSYFQRLADLFFACEEAEKVSQEDRDLFAPAGVGQSVILNHISISLILLKIMDSLPQWAINFLGRALRFAELEKRMLPPVIRKVIPGFTEESAEIEASGIYSTRIQSLAITMDKVKYILRHPAQSQNCPIRKLTIAEVADRLWDQEASVVAELTVQFLFHCAV